MATATATKKPPTDTGRCGTYAGHQRHRKRGEADCDPCAEARRDYHRGWKAAARRAPTPVVPLSEWSVFGRFAALPVLHLARMRSGMCVECFGFTDDFRHLGVTR
ncbi:hypothetical protein [Micromonospora sp. WMMD998]|uniref:hypothetical protein n=1 Tax=Micromonospora sp. WMMD998 TaxID=3016092 RepID=UPI00249CB3B7|nr:hypothetical protein [Micromonospora sp. WMMD998]WFE41930.1 hypothetical protein O7619_27180 [Micromonospora sp. WMMD998]